jgi:hypothetical protein
MPRFYRLWTHFLRLSLVRLYLKRVDKGTIAANKDEIRLFAVARNESLRLPHFLAYYRSLGVDRFFLIDNDSTDQTVPIGLSFGNVHVFRTRRPYKEHWYWMEHMLSRYGQGQWCIVVDIDELFTFPHASYISLQQLRDFLESNHSTAIRSLLLDMYAEKPITQTYYQAGDDPLSVCPYFDKQYKIKTVRMLDRKNQHYFNPTVFTGGMRERVFGKNLPYFLSKVSFFKNLPASSLTQGMHAINHSTIDNIQGVVFHTKFLFDFIEEVNTEVLREQHYANAFLYKKFQVTLLNDKGLTLLYNGSERYSDNDQLIRLKIMKSSVSFDKFALQAIKSRNADL